MKSLKSRVLISACLMGSALTLNGCGAANVIEIPASLKQPCVSTVDVSTAQTVGDLAKSIVQQDAEIEICSARKDAVIAIAESGKKRFRMF